MGGQITFGKPPPREIRGNRVGMANWNGAGGGPANPRPSPTPPGQAGISLAQGGSGSLPLEGRMAEKTNQAGSVMIRGAAKKGGPGLILGAAMKQATGTLAENPTNTPTPPSSQPSGGITTNPGNPNQSVVAKRAREDDPNLNFHLGAGQTIDGNLKRIKGLTSHNSNPSGSDDQSTPGLNSSSNELASRLSKRP